MYVFRIKTIKFMDRKQGRAMYKLLLVDDEAEVREGIISKIDWEKTGFEIAGQAENGLEALEVMEKINPDVAIIDIKMPFMDGMQLAEIISKEYPATKLMILSGFDQFDYAQKAIRFNVMEYILKPFGADELMKILDRLRMVLDEEKMRNANLENLRNQYMESLPILKERFLNALLLRPMPKEEIFEKANRFNIKLHQGRYVAALIKHNLDQESIRQQESMSTFEEKELHGYAVYETCERIGSAHECLTFMRAFGETVVLIPVEIKQDIKTAFSVLEEIRMVVEKTHPMTVTIGIGEVVESIVGMPDSFKGAEAALEHQLVEGTNRLLWITDLLPKDHGLFNFQEEMERELRTIIRAGNQQDIEKIIHKHFQRMRDEEISYQDCRLFLNEMLTSLLRIARTHNLNLPDLVEEDNLFIHMKEIGVLDNIELWFINTCKILNQNIQENRMSSIQRMVEQAKVHVKTNYYDTDLNLDTISQILHISPSYFSRMFKKESGTTFIQFLTEVRMEKAMEYILESDLKNFEIAEKIGYAEANYFSYSFKKYYGQSPTAMRKQKND